MMDFDVECPYCKQSTSAGFDNIEINDEIAWENMCDNCQKTFLVTVGIFVSKSE